MKVILVVAAIVAFAIAVVFGCPSGCSPYKDTCACDIPPIKAVPVEPSNEKPPQEKMPSYERPGVTVLDAPALASDEEKAEREKRAADRAGKKAAGLPVSEN